jgi:hypothetical protein
VSAWLALAAAVVALVWMQTQFKRASERADQALAELRAFTAAQAQGEAEASVRRQLMAMLEQPGARAIHLDPMPGETMRAVAVYDPTQKKALVVATSLGAPSGKDYELWVLRGSAAPQPAGMFRSAGGLVVAEVDPTLLGETPDAFAVSLEPAGGSPTPTKVLMVGKTAG